MARCAGRPHILLLLLLSLARTRGDALEDLRAKTNAAVVKAAAADKAAAKSKKSPFSGTPVAMASDSGMTPVAMPASAEAAKEAEYVNPLPASALPKSAVPEGTSCGEIDHELSNTWENEGKPMFSFKVTINDWRPYKQVRVTFPHNVDDVRVFDAKAIETTRDSVKVELGLHTPRGSDFSIMGKGVHSMDLTVTCIAMALPPPAPPHATDCELTKSYSIVNAWQTAEVGAEPYICPHITCEALYMPSHNLRSPIYALT